MTLSKVIRAQKGGSYTTKWCRDHKNDLDWPKIRPATITSQNSTFGSVKGFDGCDIGNQPFYFHLMTLSKLIRAQEEVPTSQSGSATTNTAGIGQKHAQPKSPPKIAHSVLPEDPTAVTSVTNHFVFIKRP